MADIFISYAREDVERAGRLVERFAAEGWSVFWDRKIPPGKEWPEILDAELTPAGCVIVLWSKSSIGARWVIEEASEGLKRKALFPVRLDPVEPPLGFRSVHASDLTDWDGGADSPGLEDLVHEVGTLLGRRRGVSVAPLSLAVVLGRPKTHPGLGAVINLACRFVNDLERPADVHGLSALTIGPDHAVSYDFDWRLVFDVAEGGAEHVRRIQRETKLPIPAGEHFETGVQLSAPILTDVVEWPEGTYKFKLRGWVDRQRHDALPNLKCDFDAALDRVAVREIEKHLALSDKGWKESRYSDDAYGVPFRLSNVRPGLPAA